ncbi:MAG: DUF2442 domain-containing protein [Cytophagales bacterium]|nr:DUF2442 domain-containing protein [Cytophagales bacterium]
MNEIIKIKVLDNYKIWLKFKDGVTKTVNFRPFIGKGFTREILNSEYFKKVKIESGGGLTWPNGYDFCPDFLKDHVGDEELVNK